MSLGKTRRRAGSMESQPEWFTHGPTSQLDTIELKGFDEVEKGIYGNIISSILTSKFQSQRCHQFEKHCYFIQI
jgi:hypothetical protein